MVLRELIFNSFSLLGRCGALEITEFSQFPPWDECGSPARANF